MPADEAAGDKTEEATPHRRKKLREQGQVAKSRDLAAATVLLGGMLLLRYGGGMMLYYIWDSILDFQDGKLRVNLLLNRASPWADVYSYIPYEGQVDIKMKKTCDTVLMRVPEWIKTGSDKVVCTIDGKSHKFGWQGRYINIGKVNGGKTVSVKFPISERTVKEKMGGADYTLVIKGNTVVSIDPPGKNCPLYQRGHFRKNQTRWRKVKRFVSNKQILW